MAFTLNKDFAATIDDLHYETDAEPIVHLETQVPNPSSSEERDAIKFDDPPKETLFNDSDDDEGPIDIDQLIKKSTPADMGHLNIENSAVEVTNSSAVRIGNSYTQKTDIKFDRTTSVLVDRRQWNYITCPDSSKIPFLKSDSRMAIVNKVQAFNRDRYRNRLAYFTPLPWCTWFSPHLDNLYTTLQLVSSDRLNGRNSHSIINLEQILNGQQNDFPMNGGPCRVLVEGNPGYGKTTLTLKLASDWASEKEYLSRFHLVFLITLRDFQGDLRSYIMNEFFPQHESAQDREDWWNYIKENHQNILFVLDGFDELSPEHQMPIDTLLKGNIFDKVSVLVTSRSVSSDHHMLSFFNRRIEIRGFGSEQTEQFIQNYYQVKQKPQRGSKLISLLNGPYSNSRHLASCPLTCLFLCVVFEDESDDGILHKMTQVYQGLVSWLVRRASNKKRLSSSHDSLASRSTTTQQYEKALSDFGLLCLQVLARGGNQFTHEQLKELPDNSCDLLLELGLLVRNNVPRSTTLCIPKSPSYQLIHKTFMEYLAAFYLSGSIESRVVAHFEDLLLSTLISKESLYLIFKFVSGLMAENAAVFFRLYHLSTFELPVITLFELLHESGATAENVRALSSILDSEVVVVRSNQIELDGWAGLLAEPDCPIRSLKFVWAEPPFNSIALDRFFTAFQTNHSVICLVITAACGLSPDENDVVAMGAFTVQALKKTQLRHFSLHLVGDTWAAKVATAVNSMLNYRYAASSLTSIKISVDTDTQQIAALTKGLLHSNVKSLVLPKLSCDPSGYAKIADLFKSLHHLSISLNILKTLPPSRVNPRYEEGSPADLKNLESYFKAAARQRAGINVKTPIDFSNSVTFTGRQSGSIETDCDNSNEASLLETILSALEATGSDNFRLKYGLRWPGIVAPNALGLLKPKGPECLGDRHTSGFHTLFVALQESSCQLSKLDLTGCCLELMDLNCLGQAIQKSPHLKSLRLAKLKSFEEVYPLLINTNLTWLDVSSGYISLKSDSIVKLLCALLTSPHLLSLSLAGWKFSVEDTRLVETVNRFMKSSTLQELNLTGCRFQMNMHYPRRSPVGSSCLSIISQVTASRNGNEGAKSSGWNPLGAFRSNGLTARSTDDLEVTRQSESSSSSDDLDLHKRKLKDNGIWPNLLKLSLTEVVASFQGSGRESVEFIGGPELFILLDQPRNLTELSVSMKPQTPESATSANSIRPLDDVTTKTFFRAIQQRLGRKLERLCMSFCSIGWQRPSHTASSVSRYLIKCERLREIECNFVQFCASGEWALLAPKLNQHAHSVESSEPVHWLVNTFIAGCPRLEELSVIGLTLTATQAYNLSVQIRDRWKGSTLRIHMSHTSPDGCQPNETIYNLIHGLKNDKKLTVHFIGGYRGTVLIRRRQPLCGLVSHIRNVRKGLPKILPLLCPSNQDSFDFQESADGESEDSREESNNIDELCANLPPGLSSLFGLTPFDYSIMRAHFPCWDSNEC